MTYRIKAHPTRYRDIEFRSRLEATWAAFFDLAGWKWKYEPIDLEGWSPDFEISHAQHLPVPIMVEVKPTWEQANEAVGKIQRARVERALLLANGPGSPADDGHDWTSGQTTYDHKPGYPLGVILYLAAGEEPYRDRAYDFCPRGVWDKHWAEATNITRWKPGK